MFYFVVRITPFFLCRINLGGIDKSRSRETNYKIRNNDLDYTGRFGGGESCGIENTFQDLLMDMTWAEKEIEDSGMTLRFGALAVSKRGASS